MFLLAAYRSEAAEKELQLRTKKMREKDELKTAIRHYRFVLLRIRFPDGVILQGIINCWNVIIIYCIFKPGMRLPQAGVRLVSCNHFHPRKDARVCVCVCVRPRGYK